MKIELRNISKTFGSFRALNDVSLSVESGELLALLGPSGSGKTTLLRIIAGLEDADLGSGPILFDGVSVSDRRVRERKVGFVFQHYALFRHMTVAKNIAFGLEVRPRCERPSRVEIRRRVRELLELVQLEGLANRYPCQLSGGQRQRVALARALALKPTVLLLDEPFGALDAKVRKELRNWLRRLHNEIHVTSVFVTHDQDEALELADRVVVTNLGKIEQIGTPDEVFHYPESEFVMNFVGDVNRFHGRLEDGKLCFADLWLEAPEDRDGTSGPARVFVRPHDLDVDIRPNGTPSLRALVADMHSAGPVVRLVLRSEGGHTLFAEISQARYRKLGLRAGSAVCVTPHNVRVFPDSS
ncbi:MAG: sulfate ABC transporter ATP-binding protein [Gemmatimonadota bacterium]|nr:MAG: sulfate ABC transporter ATP-binding protein [Gemmatimonadota bacterium]